MQLVKALVEALVFYADVDTYFAIGFFPDPPCGDFVKDFDKTGKPGARARKILKAYRSQIIKELAVTSANTRIKQAAKRRYAKRRTGK